MYLWTASWYWLWMLFNQCCIYCIHHSPILLMMITGAVLYWDMSLCDMGCLTLMWNPIIFAISYICVVRYTLCCRLWSYECTVYFVLSYFDHDVVLYALCYSTYVFMDIMWRNHLTISIYHLYFIIIILIEFHNHVFIIVYIEE